jgi:kynureninase
VTASAAVLTIVSRHAQWPVQGDSSFIEPLAAFLQANASSLNIRCCVISHISAYPSVVLPIAQLTRLLRSYNIVTIIDGAHAVGNIDIDVTSVDPDYYLGNMHKWFFSPKSAALLYVPPRSSTPPTWHASAHACHMLWSRDAQVRPPQSPAAARASAACGRQHRDAGIR